MKFRLFVLLAASICGLALASDALATDRGEQRVRSATSKPRTAITSADPLVLKTRDLSSGLTLDSIIAALVGVPSIAISNVQFTGSDSALGVFEGGTGVIGFERGIVLSTGLVANVVGPNDNTGTGFPNGRVGDPDLDSLIPGFTTEDACILEFDFECPAVREIGFEYVFSSEEYNEFVYDNYNDVFGFFVNGENIALLPDGITIVSIENVNGGDSDLPDSAAANPQYYRNNDTNLCQFDQIPSCPINTQMDGLTVVLIAEATIQPGPNHIKLAIADAGDQAYDSDVFLKGQSFVCGSVNNTAPVCTFDPPSPITVTAGENVSFTVSGTDADTGQSIYLSVLFSIPQGATMNPPLPLAGPYTGVASEFNWQTAQPGSYFANFLLTDSLGGVDSCEIDIEVLPAINNPPTCTINPPGPFNVIAGASVDFTVTGTDPDDGQTIYLHQLGNLPPGATMTPSLPRAGSRTGLSSQFSWIPTQPGVFTAGFFVTDSLGGADTAAVQITVTNPEVNVSPVCVINPPGPFTVNAGTNVTFTVSATDPNAGQIIRLSNLGTLPLGSTMTPPVPIFGPATGVSSQFSWTPTQVGTFLARFSASDSAGGFDSISARINVLEGVAPRVSSTSPNAESPEMVWDARVMIQFSERVNPSQVQTSFQAFSSQSGVRAVSIGMLTDSLITISPLQQLWPDDDEITIRVLGSLTDLAGNPLDGNNNGSSEGTPVDDYVFSFFTLPGVYPGDANDDGRVDERDVLPLGVHYLRTGQNRPRNFDIWTVEPASPWSPREATHADCDGNGVIDSLDICTILQFFDREISAKRSVASSEFTALSTLDESVRNALLSALLNCESGMSAARVALVHALQGSVGSDATLPTSFRLEQNYPNPFNAGTVISWQMNMPGHVELSVFDVLGRRVRNLIDAELPAAFHAINWDGTSDDGKELASGVYLYRLVVNSQTASRRMVLIR